ncbi:MAG: hypothetical protein R3F17_06055 [Planctomycetota bacterium]
MKEFEAPKRLPAWILLDTSASMTVSSTPRSKYELATFVAGGLALACLDRVSPVGLLGTGDRDIRIRPSLAKNQVMQWMIRLRRYRFDEGTTLARKVTELHSSLHSRALVIVLSDLHDRDGVAALKLMGQVHDVVAIQLQDPAEAGLPGAGFLRAQEAEGGADFVTSGRREWIDPLAVQGAMRRAGIDHLLLRTDRPVAQQVRHFFAGRGLVPRGARYDPAALVVAVAGRLRIRPRGRDPRPHFDRHATRPARRGASRGRPRAGARARCRQGGCPGAHPGERAPRGSDALHLRGHAVRGRCLRSAHASAGTRRRVGRIAAPQHRGERGAAPRAYGTGGARRDHRPALRGLQEPHDPGGYPLDHRPDHDPLPRPADETPGGAGGERAAADGGAAPASVAREGPCRRLARSRTGGSGTATAAFLARPARTRRGFACGRPCAPEAGQGSGPVARHPRNLAA